MQVIICALGDRRKWPTHMFKQVIFKSYFKSVHIYFIISENNLIFISERREMLYFGAKLSTMDDNYGVGVASSSKCERPSVKIAHIRLRIAVFEEFAINYNLTAHT